MILKDFFAHVLHPVRYSELEAKRRLAVGNRGIDVRSLEPTKPMTEAERAERYRSGHFAEMTDVQAGL